MADDPQPPNPVPDNPETEKPETDTPESDKLRVRVYETDPKRLVKIAKNARYMTTEQQRRLTANVAQDGVLTSVPLVYNRARQPDSPGDLPAAELVVISGNHRAESAVAAGLPSLWVMEIVSFLDESRLIALQLSHNAITGQDDPNLLFELYDALDLDHKLYSGLTDDAFKLPELDLSALSIKTPAYEEINLLFLPAEASEFRRLVQELQKKPKKGPSYLGQYDDFTRFFEAVCTTKDVLKVYNTAVAIRAMADLALLKLSEIQEAAGAPESDAQK